MPARRGISGWGSTRRRRASCYFSFSLALASGYGSGSNLVATSLDSFDTLKKKYSRAESNLAKLKNMGATILHGVNAKTMKLHADLKTRKFDRVVFNFPHAGFRGKEDQMHVIKYKH